ncbi:MAG TPA: D-aminoacylase [Gemmatimonadaceae bacterium]|nr:D-aminoacylase [Gemmatimonadaceae bacterium]
MPSRRDFLSLTGSALVAGALAACRPSGGVGTSAAPAVRTSRGRADLVIRGGTVFDGTGAPGREMDLAIVGGRIAQLGPRLAVTGAEELDARGLAVAPGFIDIHSHANGTMFADPAVESVVRQGITTVVVGQDGSSPGVGDGERADAVGAFLAAVEREPPACNVATMVGLGSVRGTVVGADDRPATADELRRMVEIVERSLAAGACGASSGLEYTPGAFASRDELVALCRPLASRGLPYSTHMRNEDDRLLDAIGESIAVAEGARCRLQIAHLKTQGPRNWARLDDAFALIEGAAARGLDVAFDRYPYVAYQTGLTNLFPVWSRDGGTDAFLARLADASTAPRIRTEVLAKVELIGGWDNVQVTSVRAAEDRAAEGKRLGEYAASVGADPYEVTVGLLRRSGGSVGMVGFAMSEENLERILAHPRGMVCSDGGAFAVEGPARRGVPHPRALGSFPRVIARYVRERGALTLEQAVHRMSGAPASRLRLADRGRIAEGLAADVVVFDPATIADRATFEDPYQYPVGIAAVIVNGAPALQDGLRTTARTGQVARPAA